MDKYKINREGGANSCQIANLVVNFGRNLISSNQPKNKAFTLAEVLITLVIIGVVAALTIPTVVKNYKKHVVETNLKKAYSILSNAFNNSIVDNGSLDFSTYLTASNETDAIVNKYFLPYLKYQSYESKTMEQHGYKKGILYPNGTVAYKPDKTRKLLILTNGMMIRFSYWGLQKNNGEYVYTAITFTIDLDGPYQGPNTYGKDVFDMRQVFAKGAPLEMRGETHETYQVISSDYDTVNDPNGYKSTYGILFDPDTGKVIFTGARKSREENLSSCRAGDSSGARFCGALIKTDGWKIKSDYPWL